MRYRTLVVEDEIIIADEINTILSKNGYDVFEPALSYQEAITGFASIGPHLVILDVELSGKKTGIDVAREIRKYSRVPIVFLTACGDPKTQKAIAEFEPLACLDKVFFKKGLLETVAAIFDDVNETEQSMLRKLSKRERQVLKMVANGFSTKEIALHLNLSESTVKNHRHSLCLKLKLEPSSNALLKWAIKHMEAVRGLS